MATHSVNKTCQRHKTCEMLAQNNAARSAAAALVLYYGKSINAYVLAVGKEIGGQYSGQFNLCAGKGETQDVNNKGEFCWLETLKRELREEFKINVHFSDKTFDNMFKGSDGKIRFIIHNKTPVFIGILPAGTSRKPIKQRMITDIQNPLMPSPYKEMSDFEFIRLDNGQQIEGNNIQVSNFAEAIRKKIDVSKL